MADEQLGTFTPALKLYPALAPWAWAVLALPLSSFIGGLVIGRRSWRVAGALATGALGAAFLCALYLAAKFVQDILPHPEIYPQGAVLAFDLEWMAFGAAGEDGGAGALAARFGFLLDAISVMMLLVITGISTLVNLYSLGYMREDPGAGRFFPLLSFFSLSMLGLVVAGNLVQTFFFWELVGTASYLLIGFWYQKPEAVAAAKKAFIITRLADAFFLAGLLLVGLHAGSFDLEVLNRPAVAAALDRTLSLGLCSVNLLALGALCIYAGGWGKSAMFPLHVWLPDAMEGPTPVSSLIHSATMVVAGVFLVARLHPLFSASSAAMQTIEATGAFTALFAAAIACTQTDLKRILAFSTLSQLGLMMLALGAAPSARLADGSAADSFGYSASMFHVFTHAPAKCLLFLAAGIVIHAIHSGDIREAGGLRRVLPRTYGPTLIACLALAGVFPLAGFFSKDEVLLAAWASGSPVTLAAGLATGALTAFYLFRFLFLTFHGARRGAAHGDDPGASHEPGVMVLPMLVLAVPSVLAGYLAKDLFEAAVVPLGSASAGGRAADAAHAAGAAWVPMVALGLALAGIVAAWLRYGRGAAAARSGTADDAPLVQRLLYRKFYIDESWLFFGRRIMIGGVSHVLAGLERFVINGLFDLGHGIVRLCAALQSLLHNGQAQFYAALGLVGLYVLYRLGREGL